MTQQQQQQDKVPVLARDPSTGDYIADFRIRVPAEFYQRAFFKHCEEENIDLAKIEALAFAMYHIGKVTNWLHHPHAKVTPIPVIDAVPPIKVKQATKPQLLPDALAQDHHASKSRMMLLSEALRKKAAHVVPHLWEEVCMTPVAPIEMPRSGEVWEAFCQWLEQHQTAPALLTSKELEEYWKKYRADIGRLRYDERKILSYLRAEWQHGDFTLDEEAARQEQLYQEQENIGIALTAKAVADAVNGSRLH